jgi:hypothetical protein
MVMELASWSVAATLLNANVGFGRSCRIDPVLFESRRTNENMTYLLWFMTRFKSRGAHGYEE